MGTKSFGQGLSRPFRVDPSLVDAPAKGGLTTTTGAYGADLFKRNARALTWLGMLKVDVADAPGLLVSALDRLGARRVSIDRRAFESGLQRKVPRAVPLRGNPYVTAEQQGCRIECTWALAYGQAGLSEFRSKRTRLAITITSGRFSSSSEARRQATLEEFLHELELTGKLLPTTRQDLFPS